LYNVLHNAGKFAHDGRVTLSSSRDGNGPEWIRFEVDDTGAGMTREQLARITRFEPFTLGDSSMSRPSTGTGLGLVIAARYCKMLGADLEIDSTAGRGTRVTIRLRVPSR
jgi:signal transduction histidine kinase